MILLSEFEDKRPSAIPIVVLDTETTGLYPGLGHRVVEIGAIRLENWQVTGEFNQLVYPERRMDPKASSINGITDDDLLGMPLFADIADDLLDFIEGALMVAHNATFDAAFLGLELFLSGYMPTDTPVLPNPWLCTLLLARRLFTFDNNSLSALVRHFGLRSGTAHRAIGDVYTTARLLQRMVAELSDSPYQTVDDLLHAQGGPIFTPPPHRAKPLPAIADAIANGRYLRIRYTNTDDQETERIITPKYITQHLGVDYLIAHCHLRDDQRTFHLDRIQSAQIVKLYQ